jgi:hypothetical protein
VLSPQTVETKEIDIRQKDIGKICQELGLKVPIRASQKSVDSGAQKKESYVRTMSLSWIIQACGLRGKCLHVGIVLWYLAGVSKSSTVKLTPSRLRRFGIHPETGRRALRTLETAQLVSVERRGHSSPLVTILAFQFIKPDFHKEIGR